MLVLAPTRVELLSPGLSDDGHGWSEPGEESVVWAGQGNMQEDHAVRSDGTMTSGASGPFDPAVAHTARLYLPFDCPVAAGMKARLGDDADVWLVGSVRISRDPRYPSVALWEDPGPGLTAVVAVMTLVSRGGEGDLP